MKVKSWFSLVFSATILLSLAGYTTQAKVIDSVTEDISQARSREFSNSKGGDACNKLENVTDSTIAGRQAFLHWVARCGERSELAMKRTVLGNTYWYGWSIYIPPSWQDTSRGYDIVNQWLVYPAQIRFKEACGAAGSYIARSKDTLTFAFQRQGDTKEVVCTKYPLAKVAEMRGKWVDFVMHAKWTGNKDGHLKLWMKIGDEPYQLKVEHIGSTYWNHAKTGPYFKMGLYKGNPNFPGPAPRYLYTGGYRLGDATSNFQAVNPARELLTCRYAPKLSEMLGLRCHN
ncbi:heparin lyase I family protein [Gloeocapsopsis crepidinum LEGE 06123]|uniref:Heparin lyase I family protein n=1 Tax=Gloeocapsopsis crepidinum LEGE 06123 TaxID=588587 RepID=A0ABR9URT5_9CHRO|nr:heparin lyase I family protein [Gloeocapsopsis crepidinum]MBE9191002.1 heparin lyase I family protein [Gloeocapsopsis crepidinum LEGE 06123]